MSCHICDSAHSRLPFLCPTCARNRLYPLRLESTQVFLEKEDLGRQIENVVSHGDLDQQNQGSGERSLEPDNQSSRLWFLQTISSKQVASVSRRDELSQKTETLKEEIRVKKAGLASRRATLSRRRADAETAQYQLGERETATLTGVQNTTKRAEHLWHSLHSKTAEARIFLCREAAHLYGLRQKTARTGDPRQLYVLGGMPIVDLRDMNGATAAQISTSFSNVAQLLVLVSHYLSLRLPAEITLPHRDYPTPTIFPPSASYDSRGIPGKTNVRSSSSPTNSKTGDTQTQPRPRPLFIEKSLQRLAKEDPGIYALFLEGATLLAWDVAWLCRTQGINLSSDSWEDVCDIGKSMYQLLVAPPAQPSSLMRAFAIRDTQTKIKPTTKDSPQTTIQRRKSFPMLGHYSHGTVHSFLAASEGSDYVRTWKLPTPTKIVDKLKANLLGEMTSAEWELLEENEWEDGSTDPHKSSTIQHPNIPASPSTPMQSNDRNQITPSGQGTDDARRPKGNNGWMKLNNR